MAKLKGAPKTGGRVKGTPNKTIPALASLHTDVIKRINDQYGTGHIGEETPLEFLMRLQNDADVPLDVRVDAAKSALPYVHQRLPQAIEHTGKDGEAIEMTLLADDAHRMLENIMFEESVVSIQ